MNPTEHSVWGLQVLHPTLHILNFSQSLIQLGAMTREWKGPMNPTADDDYKKWI